MNRMACISLIIGSSIHVLLIHGAVCAASHIRTGLREALLLRIALLRITLLREALLRIALLRIARLLREALLLGIARLLRITLLLREALLLGITLLLREALLLRITLLLREALLLCSIKSRESACTLLLSLIRLLIEEVEIIALLLSCRILTAFVACEGVSGINIEAVCKISGSTKCRSGRFSIIIAAEEVRSSICGNEACCGNSFLRREDYLTAAVINA